MGCLVVKGEAKEEIDHPLDGNSHRLFLEARK